MWESLEQSIPHLNTEMYTSSLYYIYHGMQRIAFDNNTLSTASVKWTPVSTDTVHRIETINRDRAMHSYRSVRVPTKIIQPRN